MELSFPPQAKHRCGVVWVSVAPKKILETIEEYSLNLEQPWLWVQGGEVVKQACSAAFLPWETEWGPRMLAKPGQGPVPWLPVQLCFLLRNALQSGPLGAEE